MTDERRQEDRREEDVRLAEAVAELRESIQDTLDTRIAQEWERAERIHDQFAYKGHEHVEVTRLIDVLEGAPKRMPSGEIVREGGVLHEIQQLTKAVTNGGVRIKLPPSAWAAIWTAIITGVFSVIIAVLTTPAPW